jgi:hypothetical protein
MNCLTHCWWQILAATVAYWMLGAIWFNPKVFGTIWQRSHGMPEMNDAAMEKAKKMMPMLVLKSFIFSLFICIALCYFMCAGCCSLGHCTGPEMCMPMMMHNLKVALLLSIFAIGGAMSMGYTYQMKPLSAYLVDIGYHVVGCCIAVAVLHLLCCHCG